jgi:hypothetical protein
MTAEQIAVVLERMAMLLELKRENPFKIRASTNAGLCDGRTAGQSCGYADIVFG